MFPIKLKLYGIRDFIPTELDLGNEKDQVLIGGKNGSGKSTLVFAAAFALASGRVSIDGLRSKLIKKDDHWHAGVSVLFYNPPGPDKKDAPPYVELSAEIRSRAGTESRRVIYSMAEGESPDMLIPSKKFSSRLEAHDYYKRVFDIDTEGYFMFWYQGSITQFANISDTQRFERVAEMFGIDKIKEEWDEARQAMEEAEDDFLKAKTIALQEERRLMEFEKRKNALESRDRLRAQGLLLYESCYREIKKIFEREIKEFSEKIIQIESDIKQSNDDYEATIKKQQELETELILRQNLLQRAQEEANACLNEHNQLRQIIEAYTQEKEKLESKVKDIQNKLKNIHRSPEQLREEKGRLKAELERIQKEIEETATAIQKLENEKQELYEQKGGAETKLEQANNAISVYTVLDKELPAIATLSEEQARLNSQKEKYMLQSMVLSNEIQSLKARQSFIQSQNSPLLLEQTELIEEFRAKSLKAAAFGEIFDVIDDSIFEEAEGILSPLKHVIFVEDLPQDIDVNVPFYIVNLREQGEVEDLTGLFHGDTDFKTLFDFVTVSAQAVQKYGKEFLDKVKVWCSQITIIDEKMPSGFPPKSSGLILCRQMLWDDYGVRGPFDSNPAIGEKAQNRALEDIANQLAQNIQELKTIQRKEKDIADRIKKIDLDIQKRLEVNEKFPLALEERGRLQNEIRHLKEDLQTKERKLDDLRKNDESRKRDQTMCQGELKRVEEQLAVYAECAKEAATIARINELTEWIEKKETKREELAHRSKQLQETIEDTRRNIKDLKADFQETTSHGEHLEKRLSELKREKQKLEEERTSVEIESEEKIKEYKELQAQYGPVIENLKNSGQWLTKEFDDREKNRPNLERKFNDAKRDLDEANQRPVDEDARQKYNDYLALFNNAKKEMDESELRFNILKKKEEEKRSEYDKNVYYRLQRTNQRFFDYMQRLNMVGNIVSIAPDEEGKNKSYRWELHVATKIGHKPERISPESGKIVGEGISGGERAAVSLVFALALLSDIENKPPFYVLDEFDSALDEERKHEIFDLYREVLDRKMIIISPKVHGDQYLYRFSKFLCVVANPGVEPNRTISEVYEVTREGYKEADLEE